MYHSSYTNSAHLHGHSPNKIFLWFVQFSWSLPCDQMWGGCAADGVLMVFFDATSCFVILSPVAFSSKTIEHTTVELQTVPLGPICFSSLALWSHILPTRPSVTLLKPYNYQMNVLVLLLCLSQVICSPNADIWMIINCNWSAWCTLASVPYCFSCRWFKSITVTIWSV